jgi:2-keto-3-deoxy-L-rhamnonate aldolase RhmA
LTETTIVQNKNPIREKLSAGKTVTGMLLFTGSPMVVEMMAVAGMDFVIVDMEHSALDIEHAAHLIRTADAAGITPFIRVPGVDAPLIKKLLNLGAAGIVLPHANQENCRELLDAMHYAPLGSRGACQIVRSAGYTRGDWNAHAERANREVMAIALLEEASTIAGFDALAAMPGIDLFFVGPTDLSISLGVPGATFDDDKMRAALDRVVTTARKHGKHVMTLIGNNLDIAYGKRIVERGVQAIAIGTDGDLFLNVMRPFAALKE